MQEIIYDIAETREAGRPVRMTLPRLLHWMQADHLPAIMRACDLARSYVTGPAPVSGSDTGVRMAARLASGMTIEGAAAREYLYRWGLALGQWINHAESRSRVRGCTGAWPAPHLIGM